MSDTVVLTAGPPTVSVAQGRWARVPTSLSWESMPGWARLSDGTDDLRLESTHHDAKSVGSSHRTRLTRLDLPTSRVVRQVRLRVRARSVGGTSTLLMVAAVGDRTHVWSRPLPAGTGWVDYDGPWWTVGPAGTGWTVDTVNQIEVRAGYDQSAAGRTQLSGLSADVETSPAPQTIVAGPQSPVGTSRPTVEWTVDVGSPSGFEAELYAGEPAVRGGTPLAVSGVQTGEGPWTPPVDLPDSGLYTVFVRTLVDGWWTRWASRTFTVAFDPPGPPTFTVRAEDGAAALAWEVDGTDDPPANAVVIERDCGHGWERVATVPAAEDGWADQTVPLGVPVRFRVAAAVRYQNGLATSTPAEPKTVTVRPGGTRATVWVSIPDGETWPALEMARQTVWQGRDTVMRPADLPYTVVESGPPTRVDKVRLLFETAGQVQAARRLAAETRTLLWRTRSGQVRPVRIVGDRTLTPVGPSRWSLADLPLELAETGMPDLTVTRLPDPTFRVEYWQPSDPRVLKDGWTVEEGPDRNGGVYARSSALGGDTLTFETAGTVVRILGTRGPSLGIMHVTYGGVTVPVDLYSPVWQFRQVVWEQTGLGAGTHRVVVTSTGTKHVSSSATNVEVDAIDAPQLVVPTVPVEPAPQGALKAWLLARSPMVLWMADDAVFTAGRWEIPDSSGNGRTKLVGANAPGLVTSPALSGVDRAFSLDGSHFETETAQPWMNLSGTFSFWAVARPKLSDGLQQSWAELVGRSNAWWMLRHQREVGNRITTDIRNDWHVDQDPARSAYSAPGPSLSAGQWHVLGAEIVDNRAHVAVDGQRASAPSVQIVPSGPNHKIQVGANIFPETENVYRRHWIGDVAAVAFLPGELTQVQRDAMVAAAGL